jgi:hypothetical protein
MALRFYQAAFTDAAESLGIDHPVNGKPYQVSLISLGTIDVSHQIFLHQMRQMVRPDYEISGWWNRW